MIMMFKCSLRNILIFSLVLCAVNCDDDSASTTGDAASSSSGTSKSNKQPWNSTWTDLLKKDLLANYDTYARPTQHFNTTNVNIKLTIRHVDLDEAKSTFTVIGWMKMDWIDEKLKWNKSDYGNISLIHLADHEIWQPDITLYNSADGSTIDHFGNTYCLLDSNGSIIWVPPVQFRTYCELNMRKWPFDEQTCKLRFGSWAFDGNKLNISFDEESYIIDLIVENHEWELLKVESIRNITYYTCCEEPYLDLLYLITIKRRSPMYSAILTTPAVSIILMTLTSFWLPPSCGEKIILNGVNAIIICIFLVYFTYQLPGVAHYTPLIVLFYSSALYMICFSMIISVIVLNISKTKYKTPVPWFIKIGLDSPFGQLLGLKSLYLKLPSEMHGEEMQSPSSNTATNNDDECLTSSDAAQILKIPEKYSVQQDWFLLAIAIDRLAFLFYCFIFIILAILYSV
uniref:Putative acetylcholine receptor n=1 Tax=Corethrella appendiculata TaxID=1370023 RepID=U5EQR7_9DIPT